MAENQQRIIVITGATRGLGLAMVEKFIQLGHTVCGCGRAKEAIVRLQKQYPTAHHFDAVDVSDSAQVEQWARRLLSNNIIPDMLINNAAIMNRPASLWKIPANEFSDIVDINIKGVAHVIQSFVPAMVQQQAGIIVNFSSGWGRSTAPEVGPYCTTKWAIEGLSQALSQELPPGMASVALNPGVIDTDMLRTCWGGSAGLYPTPEQWAERAVSFLLNIRTTDNGRALSVA